MHKDQVKTKLEEFFDLCTNNPDPLCIHLMELTSGSLDYFNLILIEVLGGGYPYRNTSDGIVKCSDVEECNLIDMCFGITMESVTVNGIVDDM